MYRAVFLSMISLALAACASQRVGHQGPATNPLEQLGQAPGLLRHFPVLQSQPAPLGPAMDAYPVVDPPEVKRVWITAHDNDHGDRISGHYVDVLYHKPRFAPLPDGVARIPVAPQLAPFTPTNPTPAGTLMPHDRQAPGQPAPHSQAPIHPRGGPGQAQTTAADLMKRIEQLRQAMPGNARGVTALTPRPEDGP